MQHSKKFQLAAWRWHFYAGLFVIPFMIMLSITGIFMLYKAEIEAWQYPDQTYVTVQAEERTAGELLTSVKSQYPEAIIQKYIAAKEANLSDQFFIKQDGKTLIVYINPYTAEVLGDVDKSGMLYTFMDDMHGTFLIGDLGDRLIEIATGLTIMLVITGLYLWWPRDGRWAGLFWPRLGINKRTLWRDLHSSIGFYISIILVFFAFSGLLWTGVWGKQIVQAWSTFPAGVFGDIPTSDITHASLNTVGEEEVPWNLEHTPMPESGSTKGVPAVQGEVNIDSVIAYAKETDFTHYRLSLPTSETGVYTLAAATMSRDITDATQDRTVHIDQYTGNKLADIGFSDYSLLSKSVAVGVPLHMGLFGTWNKVLNTIFCLAVIFVCISGVIIWWIRRPQNQFTLAAPPLPNDLPHWAGATVIFLALALAFPLVGLTFLVLLSLDFLILSRVPALQRAFK